MNELKIEMIDSKGVVRKTDIITDKDTILKQLATMLIESKERMENYTIEELNVIVFHNVINTSKYDQVTIKRSFYIELY